MFSKKLKINGLEPKIPIIQGGMGVGISMSGLAAAVANEGGIGVIATAGIGYAENDFYSDYREANKRALRVEIRKAKSLTKGILGVNVMVALTNYQELIEVSVEEKIDIIFSGAGLPLNLPEFVVKKNSSTRLVPIVSSAKAINLITKRWIEKYGYVPDAVVVEGPKAGGHLGFKRENLDNEDFKLENLVKEVVEIIKPIEESTGRSIPVIAAGGIYTGGDIYEILSRGASGVQMATRFVATTECDASTAFKEAFINSVAGDMEIINSPVGMPGRALRNEFIDAIQAGQKKPFNCPYHCIRSCDYKNAPFCIALALINAKKGNFRHGFAFAGVNAYRIEKIISVKELFEDILAEYNNDKISEMKPF
jgi:NAD(P)H-dependent flavin oxidoreductase YrpB (nitropropane dioxygenase family)